MLTNGIPANNRAVLERNRLLPGLYVDSLGLINWLTHSKPLHRSSMKTKTLPRNFEKNAIKITAVI
jgi:hypothetical protein